MSDVLPTIHALADCADDLERALWLLEAEQDVLLSCEMTIRSMLREARFLEGVKYLEIELAALRRKRRRNGDNFHNTELVSARRRIERFLLGLPPR